MGCAPRAEAEAGTQWGTRRGVQAAGGALLVELNACAAGVSAKPVTRVASPAVAMAATNMLVRSLCSSWPLPRPRMKADTPYQLPRGSRDHLRL